MNNRNVIKNFFNRLAPDWMDEDELAPVRDEIVRRSALSEIASSLMQGAERVSWFLIS